MPAVQKIISLQQTEFWSLLDPNNMRQLFEAFKEEVISSQLRFAKHTNKCSAVALLSVARDAAFGQPHVVIARATRATLATPRVTLMPIFQASY